MSLSTPLPSASSQTIVKFFETIGWENNTRTQPVVVRRAQPAVKEQSIDINDFIHQLCLEDARLDATVSEGAKWVAETFYADCPDSFRMARMKAGLTQKQLAQKINTSQSYIAKLERGELSVGLDVIGRVAKAMSLEPKSVFELLFAEYEKKNG